MTLRISLILNVLLFIALITLGAFTLWRDWLFAEYRDGRPQGETVILSHDYLIHGPPGSITLPKGTILQESTPHGASTLGKVSGREFILVIHSEDSVFTPHSNSKGSWMSPYSFDLTK
jgi:hypothetical protein